MMEPVNGIPTPSW